jgi:TPR repeat protein
MRVHIVGDRRVRTTLFRLLAAFLGLGAAAIAPLAYSGGAAGAELGASLYPDLMEFDEAFKLYERGELERARNGFRHLAELGDPEARLNLGVMLAKGEGGDADLVEAVAWIRWAADQGSDGAAQVLSVLERSLDDTHRERAATRLAEQSLPRETETAPAGSGQCRFPPASIDGKPQHHLVAENGRGPVLQFG